MEKKAADPATEKVSTAEERGLLVKAAHRTEEKVEISGGMKVSEAGKEKALSSYSRPMKLGFVGEQPAPPKLNLPKNGQPPKREDHSAHQSFFLSLRRHPKQQRFTAERPQPH